MAEISTDTVEAYFEAGANGATTTDQGRALEDLICYVFEQVPGISVTKRDELNAFNTQEIDVAFWNEQPPDGFFFLPEIILVECKNWANPISSAEVAWFDTKVRMRGVNFAVLVAANGITGDAAERTAAHSIVAAALADKRRLVVITKEDLLGLGTSEQLVRLIKEKLCTLVVQGTLG